MAETSTSTSTPSPSHEMKTYKGSCHCGAIAFSLTLPRIEWVSECNCSICFRKGYAWVFPPEGAKNLVFEEGKGEEGLRGYEFAGETTGHLFCPVCGTGVMGKRHHAEPGMDIGINARTLEDVDVWKLEVRKVDGASYEPKWIPHELIGPEPTAEIEDAKMYYGSCHCGATTIALKNKGGIDSSTEMVECNCTICYKVRPTFFSFLSSPALLSMKINHPQRSLRHIYPLTTQLSILTNPSHPLTSYTFGRKMMKHMFCPKCGIQVYTVKVDVDKETYRLYGRPGSEELGERELERQWRAWGEWTCFNVRNLEGVVWDDVGVKNTYWRGFLEGVDIGR
ncbi:hypothetical protein HYFRA_00013733 [Hymenoscyphus fraxineus]|uniref:CENP-V/GFA domain-containing protein n=1 Tax=Hymenoscyphus fraxineus TaxID=746836 RepID=A0A9N9LCC6_9HELO|nr:hypothetical protein HYFRA_00013733 [Hymenoscyphus fraxineus]